MVMDNVLYVCSYRAFCCCEVISRPGERVEIVKSGNLMFVYEKYS